MKSIAILPQIYVILPVYNRREITLSFVRQLKSQTYRSFKLLLIDDGSTDGTAEAVMQEMDSVVVIRGKGDWWWAGGLQQGINWIKSRHEEAGQDDVVLMINDDVYIEDDFLYKGLITLMNSDAHLLKAEAYNLQTGKLVSRGVKANLWSLKFKKANKNEEINCLSTMGLFLKVSTMQGIGNFYPRFLPHYLSDYEYTIRAFKRGYKLFTHPEVKLVYNSQTTGFQSFKELEFGLFLRNYFSTKSAVNPLSWSSFVILACPRIIAPFLLTKIWYGAILAILKRLLYISYFKFLKNAQV